MLLRHMFVCSPAEHIVGILLCINLQAPAEARRVGNKERGFRSNSGTLQGRAAGQGFARLP